MESDVKGNGEHKLMTRDQCNKSHHCISSLSLGALTNCEPPIQFTAEEMDVAAGEWGMEYIKGYGWREHQDRKYWKQHAIPCIQDYCKNLDHCRILEIGGQWYNAWVQEHYLKQHPNASYWVADPAQSWEFKRKQKRYNPSQANDPRRIIEHRLNQVVKCRIFENFLLYKLEDALVALPQLVGYFDVIISFGVLGDAGFPFHAATRSAAEAYMGAALRALRDGGLLLTKWEDCCFDRKVVDQWAREHPVHMMHCGGGAPWDSMKQWVMNETGKGKGKGHGKKPDKHHYFVFYRKNSSIG
eukprot:gnl/MRDRNA2_/MRDRNA2_34195_c0_seq2.p1 gnl/MRDRNA2_/MRDRNA2_34195_c0~~gnl/MRDRNA2_/MRDRNA2_34195_c0_seq2.p1  ORF type:complete len:306 (-),score=50.76 gnl/MRDRNA2_/MRDRNA2_34195_c0_seq2:40-936(-)